MLRFCSDMTTETEGGAREPTTQTIELDHIAAVAVERRVATKHTPMR